MRMLPHKRRFLRIGMLAVVAAVSFWICSARVETKERTFLPEDRPPMYVLQVGIGKYLHAPVWAELRGAVTDVVEMRKVLEGDRYGIPASNIVTLTDAQGTKQQIFEKFRSHLVANAQKHFATVKDRKKGAVVLFQFSGHGSQVPDKNNDERDDGKDETLVTHDSQDAPGKNFDITDDEIYALTRELAEWTDNIVYILDSCHSGTGTRDSEDVRRLPERKTVPEPVAGVGLTTRSGDTKKIDGDSGVLPSSDEYIVITAARANELASQKNCFEECGDSRRPVVFGNLTFYLIDELKNARSDTSYRELMENVRRRVVSEKPTQTPQLEGDASRFVFGSLGGREDNFVRVVEAEAKLPNGTRTIKIGVGAMQGVTVRTLVSFYDTTVTRFDGAEKISTGIVSSVAPGESTVDLISPTREITPADKALVVAPDLGSLKLKVDLDVDATKLTVAEKRVVALARNDWGADPMVRFVPPSVGVKKWDVALLKDKFSTVASKIQESASEIKCSQPVYSDKDAVGPGGKPDREVFYFAGRDFVPLYRFCMETEFADEAASAEVLRKVITQLAAIRSINSIANKRSAMAGKVTVKTIKLEGDLRCTNSRLSATTHKTSVPDAKTGWHAIGPRGAFWFEVTNNSKNNIYVALLNVDPSGSVSVLSPNGNRIQDKDGLMIPPGGKRIVNGDDCRGEGSEIESAWVFLASRRAGFEQFKFVFSTEPLLHSHFAGLELPPLPGTQRSGLGSLASSKDWTTFETIFKVTDTSN